MGGERFVADVDSEQALRSALDLLPEDREELPVQAGSLVSARRRAEHEREAGGERRDRRSPTPAGRGGDHPH